MAGEGAGGEGGGENLPRCHWHGTRPATAMCVSCARPVCGECDRLLGLRHFCPECADAAYPYLVPPPPPVQPLEPVDEREKRWWRADWGLLEFLVALIAVFVPYNAIGLVLHFTMESPEFFDYLAYALVFCPLIAASVWFILRRHGRGREELGLRCGSDPPRTLAFGALGTVAALAMSYGVFFLIILIYYLAVGHGPFYDQGERLQDLSKGCLVLLFIVTVVLAPVFEELFFRGLFYPALRRRVGVTAAIVLNGVIFGILHFQPLYMLSLILVGVVLAYLYEKTDSLAAPMITHALYNLVVTLVSLLAGW